ncbi:MAG: NrsF family protein [Vicinamibacterales bacterium]
MTAPPDDLIGALVRDLRPVTPLRSTRRRLGTWTVMAVTVAVAATALLGLRRDWASAAGTLSLEGHTVLLVAGAWLAAWGALRLSVPGDGRARRVSLVPLALLLMWTLWIVTDLAAAAPVVWTLGRGWVCVIRGAAAGMVPGLLLWAMVRRGQAAEPRAAAVLVVAAGAALGAVASEWMCPNTRAVHLFVWHVAPVAAAVTAAFLLARRWRRGSGTLMIVD